MLQLNKVTVPIAHEDTEYGSFSVTNGHGQLTKAGVSVQIGASSTAHVEIQMSIVTNEDSKTWTQNNHTLFNDEQASEIQEHFHKSDTASGWNAIFASGFTEDTEQNSFQNANAKRVTIADDTHQAALDRIKKLQSQKVTVTGDLNIVGVSMIPTTTFIFAEITTITFDDGSQMHVINESNPVAADASGDTSGAKVQSGKLNVVPI